jgi:hypothetical protein
VVRIRSLQTISHVYDYFCRFDAAAILTHS